jgi:hypothetical protein
MPQPAKRSRMANDYKPPVNVYMDFIECDVYHIFGHGSYNQTAEDKLFFDNKSNNGYIVYTSSVSDLCLINMDTYIDTYFKDPVDILKSYAGHYNEPSMRGGGADEEPAEFYKGERNEPVEELEYMTQHLHFTLPNTPKCPNITIDLTTTDNIISKGIHLFYNYVPNVDEHNANKIIINYIMEAGAQVHLEAKYIYNSIRVLRNRHGLDRAFIVIFNACGDDILLDDAAIYSLQKTMRDNHYDFLEKVGKERIEMFESPLERIEVERPIILHMPSDREIVHILNEIYGETTDMRVGYDASGLSLHIHDELYYIHSTGSDEYYMYRVIPANEPARNRICGQDATTLKIFDLAGKIARHLRPIYPKTSVTVPLCKMNDSGQPLYVNAKIAGDNYAPVIQVTRLRTRTDDASN